MYLGDDSGFVGPQLPCPPGQTRTAAGCVTYLDRDTALATTALVPATKPASSSKTKAKAKAAKQGGSVMIDRSLPANVEHRILGVAFPEWVAPWMVYAGLGAAALLAGRALLPHLAPGGRRRRRTARNPRSGLLDAILGPSSSTSNGRRGERRSRRVYEHPDPDVRKAVRFREDFHWGIPARRISRKKVSPTPKVLTELGEIASITYRTKKRGESAQFFEHEFAEGGGRRPKLAMDIRNKKLHVVGGTYTVTADGITG